MLEKLYPDLCVESIWDLDISFYKSNNIEGVIFDIDNTLVTSDKEVPNEEVLKYFEFLRNNGIKSSIVSNNNMQRVDLFCQNLGIPYSGRAYKPLKKHLKKMCMSMGVSPNRVCLVGDQLFTDIYGANRMGFFSVLVTALGANETRFVAFKRIFEGYILNKYNNKDEQKKNLVDKKCKKQERENKF